jgi:hypothetical protein
METLQQSILLYSQVLFGELLPTPSSHIELEKWAGLEK